MKLIDLTYLKNMSNNDNETILEFIDIFKEQCLGFIVDFKQYLNNNNYKELSLLAHKVKSSLAIMGIKDFANEMKIFEALTKEEKDVSSYQAYINNFEERFNMVLTEIEELKIKLKIA